MHLRRADLLETLAERFNRRKEIAKPWVKVSYSHHRVGDFEVDVEKDQLVNFRIGLSRATVWFLELGSLFDRLLNVGSSGQSRNPSQ